MNTPYIRDIIQTLEQWAPAATAEEFDNVGLLVGHADRLCTGTLICLDTTEAVIEEAISNNCNFIISFHPIIFSGLKKIIGKNYVDRTVLKAVENQIAIYAIHTALDNHPRGVNFGIAQKLGLTQLRILIPQNKNLKKLNTYVPNAAVEQVKNALFEAGAGQIGAYSHCSFENQGMGQFLPHTEAQPSHGKNNELTQLKETQLQISYDSHREAHIIAALKAAHPYEEVAFECYALENSHSYSGMGAVGLLPEAVSEQAFLEHLKRDFNPGGLRHSKRLDRPIKTVAVLGGSGSFAIKAAKRSKADAFITADLKYHNFFEAEEQLLLVDVGHYESEQFTKKLILDYLSKKIPNFAFILAATNTNPVNYF